MSLNLRKSYYLFKLTKFLIVLLQLMALVYFILWNINFWEAVSPSLLDIINKSGASGIDSAFELIFPSIISIGVFLLCLFGLAILRRIILSFTVLPSTIVRFEKNGEIHPLFARRLVSHFRWERGITMETFYQYYLDSLEQVRTLRIHQSNKDFYDFLCKYDGSIGEDVPYQFPSTTNQVVIRRSEDGKIEPTVKE